MTATKREASRPGGQRQALPWWKRRTTLVGGAIFVLALTVRLIYAVEVHEAWFWRVPLIDAAANDEIAQDFAAGHWLQAPYSRSPATAYATYYQPPLYPVFLGIVYTLLGRALTAARVLQFLMGSASCVFAYLLGRKFFDERVGVVAGAATALTATQIYYEADLLPVALVTVLNLALLWLTAQELETRSGWRWAPIGLLFGLSVVTRPDIVLFAPCLLAVAVAARRRSAADAPGGARAKTGPRLAAWLAAGAVLAVLPTALTTARNALYGGDMVVLSSNGGLNFYLGNNADSDRTVAVRPGWGWQEILFLPTREAGLQRPAEQDRYFWRKSFEWIRSRPFDYARLMVRKAALFWRGVEILRNTDEYYPRRASSLYSVLLWRIGGFGFPFGLIAPLALLGLALNVRRARALALLYAYAASQFLAVVLFFVVSRYRAPALPVLAIFAAAAVFSLVEMARARRFGSLAASTAALAVCIAASALGPPGYAGTPSQVEAENLQLEAEADRILKKPDEALRRLQEAVALNPALAAAHGTAAKLYYERGDLAAAEREFREALRYQPHALDSRAGLALVCLKQGRAEEAQEQQRLLEAGQRELMGFVVTLPQPDARSR